MKIVSQDTFLGGGGLQSVESTNTSTGNRLASPSSSAGWMPNSIGETAQDFGQMVTGAWQTGVQAKNDIANVWKNPNINFGNKILTTTVTPPFAALDILFGDVVLGLGKMGINQEKEDELKGIVTEVASKVANSEEAQAAVRAVKPWYDSLDENDQEFVKSVLKAGSTMFDVGTFGAGKSLTAPTKELLSRAFSEAVKLPGKLTDKTVDTLRGVGRGDVPPPPPPPGGAGELARPALSEATDAIAEAGARATSNVTAPGAIKSSLGEFIGRAPRAVARGVDAYDEAAERAARLAASSPVVQQGIKSNLADDLINFTQTADEATVTDARKMLDIAETTPTNLIPKQNPGDIAGQAAAKQYQLVEAQRRAVGQKIGDLTDDLAKQGVEVDMKPAYRQAVDILRANGMLPKVNGKIKFDTKKYTPQQQDVIQKLYQLAMQEKVMSPTQVHEMDQLFSKLQRELLENGKVSDVYVKVPSSKGVVEINIFKVFREIFSEHLAKLSPELKAANAEYRKYKNIVDDIEATLIKKGNLKTNADVNPAEYARTSLRRIFSDAASSADYKAIYNKLDKLSRELGYTGSRADTLSLFASKLRDLYPDTIPKNSFQGGIQTGINTSIGGTLLDMAGKVIKTGAPDVRDQQKALRALLEDRANFGFTPKAAPKPKTPKTPKTKPEPESSKKDTTDGGDALVEKATTELQKRLRDNKQAGFFSLKAIVEDIANMFRKEKKGSFKMDGQKKRVKITGEQKGEVINEGDDWSNWGQETKRDRDWRNRNDKRGMANFGAMAEDIAGIFKKKAADPTIRTKRAVDVKTVSGEKVSIPEGAVISPVISGGKVNISVDGKDYAIPKNQYQNLVGQSDRSVAAPFAPELEGTVETVRGARSLENEIDLLLSDEMGEGMTRAEARDYLLQDAESEVATKYSQYTLPGGENYREILVQAPVKSDTKMFFDMEQYDKFPAEVTKVFDKYTDNYDAARKSLEKLGYEVDADMSGEIISFGKNPSKEPIFKSSHWDEPNVAFHLRMNERKVGNNRYAFMEEAQSDWAREGRDKGFAKDTTVLPQNLQRWKKGDTYSVKLPDEDFQFSGKSYAEAEQKFLDNLKNNQEIDGAIPSHPILKNWQIPAVKRALIEAVDSGADRFAWINGAQTSERYNLATYVENVLWKKQVSNPKVKSITITPKEGGKSISFPIDENGVITESPTGQADWKGKKLDEVLGKGLADKIMEKSDGTLSGEGLKFGGEWAENLYDKQIPNIVKKLTGAEVKTVDMGLGTGKAENERWTIPIGEIGNNTGVKPTPENLKTGIVVRKSKPSEPNGNVEDYYVVETADETGTVKLLSEDEAVLWLNNTEKLYKKYGERIETNTDTVIRDALAMGELKDAATVNVNVSPEALQTQQYIELTPEVKAKIRSEAPSFSMKTPSAGESLPLLLLMLGGATYASEQ